MSIIESWPGTSVFRDTTRRIHRGGYQSRAKDSTAETMDQQEQQRVNEAADQFTDALVQSYRVLAERGISVQEQNAQVS